MTERPAITSFTGEKDGIPTRRCSVPECEGLHKARGYCAKHYRRWQIHGDPYKLGYAYGKGYHGPGDRNPNWRGSDVTYSGFHQRLYKIKGKASEHACVNCGGSAAHWSYDYDCPEEKISEDGRGLVYSTDPSHYIPLCSSCHYWHDKAKRESVL